MARFHEDSDEEFPDLAIIINRYTNLPTALKAQCKSSAKRVEGQQSAPSADIIQDHLSQSMETERGVPKQECLSSSNEELRRPSSKKAPDRRQRSLKMAHVNSLLLPFSNVSPLRKSTESPETQKGILREASNQASTRPRRTPAGARNQHVFEFSPNSQEEEEEDIKFEDASEFSTEEAASDTEIELPCLPSRTLNFKQLKLSGPKAERKLPGARVEKEEQVQSLKPTFETTDVRGQRNTAMAPKAVASPRTMIVKGIWTEVQPSSPCSQEDHDAVLKYSPRSFTSPRKQIREARPRTPTRDKEPVRATLNSPSKQSRLPPSPHRPSIDAFWRQDIINDWIDQYSPKKIYGSTRSEHRAVNIHEVEEGVSPSTSPRKHPAKASIRKIREASKARVAFNQRKQEIAESFLKEVDVVVAGAQITAMTAAAGGVRIVWSKKLNSTAGRANWKCEHTQTRTGSATTTTDRSSSYRHIATIELAEKVIDNEERLLNVIAHEYCHLANFMISGVKDNPHGKEFKKWARICSTAFHNRGVEVTTKHSYMIDYKHIWECIGCGTEFKRHSKSIDPLRHSCGSCKSKLIQIQPPPRSSALSDYQLYIKDHFREVKMAHPGKPQKELFGILAAAYKEQLVSSPQKLAGVHEPLEATVTGLASRGEIDQVSKDMACMSLDYPRVTSEIL